MGNYTPPSSYYTPPGKRASGKFNPFPLILLLLIVGLGSALYFIPATPSPRAFDLFSSNYTYTYPIGNRPVLSLVFHASETFRDVGTIFVRAGGTGKAITIEAPKYKYVDLVNGAVQTNNARFTQISFHPSYRGPITLTVPGEIDLRIKTSGGHIKLEGIKGQMIVESYTGNITCTRSTILGPSLISTNKGKVDLQECKQEGPVNIKEGA